MDINVEENSPRTSTTEQKPPTNDDTTSDRKTDDVAATASSGDKVEEKPKKPAGPKLLDLAFGMDCTGSMGSYIRSAQQVSL